MLEIFHSFIMGLFLVNVVMTVAVMEVPEGHSALHYRIIGLSCAKVAAGLALVNLIVSIGAGIQGQVAILYLIILVALVAYVVLQEQALKKYKIARSISVKRDIRDKRSSIADSKRSAETHHEDSARKKLEERKETLRNENASRNSEKISGSTSESLSEVEKDSRIEEASESFPEDSIIDSDEDKVEDGEVTSPEEKKDE